MIRVGRAIGGLGVVVLLSWPAMPAAQGPAPARGAMTFTKDVAPILNRNCVSCHRPGEIAPMSLTTYEAARPWARAIRKAVADRVMPPWGADPQYGEFINDPSLSAADVATIVAWADGGAVEGDRKDLPPAPVFAEGWKIGTPDLVLKMTDPAPVPASGLRIIQDYPIDSHTFSEDTFVERMEVVPSNRLVTHHAIVNVKSASGTTRIGGYQPGGALTAYPSGIVRMIPKGTTIGLNMHYNPKGTPQADQTTIAMVFAKGPVAQVALTAMAGTRDFSIPPGEANYEVKSNSYVFKEDSHVIALLPRMNERGKDYKYTLTYPDGRSVVLLSVPKFNPDWQPSYVFKTAIAAPKGSRIDTVAHYDNSANNKSNPDPAARIGFGPEIMNGYFDYTVDGFKVKSTN
jgi:mono/diheme cytochrome c family protein